MHDYLNLQDQYKVIHADCLSLREQYETLYQQFHVLIESFPARQKRNVSIREFRQLLQEFRVSQQAHRQSISQFRHTIHQGYNIRSLGCDQISRTAAKQSVIRKVIVLGAGSEENTLFLKEGLERVSTHRVFLAADSGQVLRLVQTVHIDLLVLDNELTPLSGFDLYRLLHSMKGLQALPAIILSNSFSSRFQAELARLHLFWQEKPVKVESLIQAIDKFLVKDCWLPSNVTSLPSRDES